MRLRSSNVAENLIALPIVRCHEIPTSMRLHCLTVNTTESRMKSFDRTSLFCMTLSNGEKNHLPSSTQQLLSMNNQSDGQSDLDKQQQPTFGSVSHKHTLKSTTTVSQEGRPQTPPNIQTNRRQTRCQAASTCIKGAKSHFITPAKVHCDNEVSVHAT